MATAQTWDILPPDGDEDDYLSNSDLRSFQLQLVNRLTKDAMAKINEDPANMTKDEIRFLVTS